jgi:hypothetical protein
VHEEFKIDHTTVQIEDVNEPIMDSCDCNLGAWHSAR